MNAIDRKRLGSAFSLFICAAFFSFVGLFGKVAKPVLNTWQISFGRALFGIVSMLLIHAIWKVRIDGPNRSLLVLRGISGTLCFVCLIAAMQLIPLGTAMVLFFLFPVFASILSPWINRESVSIKQWLYIVVSFCGACLVLGPEALDLSLGWGYLWGISAALFAGLNINLVRRLSAAHSTFCIYFYWSLVAAGVSFFPALQKSTPHTFSIDALEIIIAIGLFATVAQLCMNYGFVHLNAPEGSLILMSQVPIATALGVIFFHEKIGSLFVIGAVLILLGAVGLSRPLEEKDATLYSKSA